MTTVGYEGDPTKMIVSELRKSSNLLPQQQKYYFQVDYPKKQILKFNPQWANHYQKSIQQQNIRQYFDQCNRDQYRYLNFKYQLKSRYFKIHSNKPKCLQDSLIEKQPLEIIKSYSRNLPIFNKDGSSFSLRNYPLSQSQISNKKLIPSKSRYSDQFQVLLQNSQRFTKKPNRYKLKGGTIREKQKLADKIMREEKNQILNIIKFRDYTFHRPDSVQQVQNKDKYSLSFIDYMRLKTKNNLQKQLFQKKIRKPNSRLQNFQEFIIDEGKFKGKAKQRLSDYYIKIRDEIKNSPRNSFSFKQT